MSNLRKIAFHTEILGDVCIICKDKKIYEVCIGVSNKEIETLDYSYKECLIYRDLFMDYLSGKPLEIKAENIYIERVSPFYQDVYRETLKIPFGNITTYKDIAKSINRPRAYRAVATALRKNPFPVFVPCHRIIRSDGKIGGVDKRSFFFRKILLDLERRKNG